MKIWKQAVLFYLGGCAYMGLELLWRGRSHGSMFVAGGTCFLLIGHLNHVRPRLPLPPPISTMLTSSPPPPSSSALRATA